MMTISAKNRLRLLLVVCFCAALWSCGGNNRIDDSPRNYRIIHKDFLQPIDHSNPGGPKFRQQVDILIPEGAPHNAPVFFHFGNETDITQKHLLKYYRLHGERDDIIYIQAEHRGYGQSLTEDEDQSLPSYVRLDQVLADAHEVIEQLKKDYPGPWMAAGWSYGGALVIELAYKYPEDVEVILSSSGVVDWPLLDYGYDRQVQKTLGDACYNRLTKHSQKLEPKEPFDENWMEREFMQATVMGVVQFPSLKKLQPYFKVMTFLPTGIFLKLLHRMDDKFGDGEAWKYTQAISTKKVTQPEIDSGLHNWRVWRYQMCVEIGGFITSEDPKGLFARSQEDFCEECRILFDEEPAYVNSPEWSQREMVTKLAVPMVYVNGGMDPWHSVCLESDFKIENGIYFYVPDGRHCPERDDPELARKVFGEMLKYAGYNSRNKSGQPQDAAIEQE